MIEFVTFGIIIDDIVFPQGYTRMGIIGGGGPQTAWGMAAALGSGESVGLVAGVGMDLEEKMLAPLFAAGINLDGVRHTDLPTPRAWQTVEFSGRRAQVWRVPVETLGSQLARDWDHLPFTYQRATGFHWGMHPTEPGWLAFAQQLRQNGQTVSVEPFRPPEYPLSDDSIRAMLESCDIFSPNWQEATALVQETDYVQMIARYRALGGRILALRRGPDGADVWNLPENRGVHVPAIQTEIVDVVGTGNAFCGALLARLDEGIEEAACHASAAASYLLEQVGLPPALPRPEDYERRLQETRAGLTDLTPG